jgi:NADH-quinone oxidoreductase subunit J
MILQNIILYSLALVIAVFAILAVTTRHIIRSATYLLFVLLGTAFLYLLLNYHFLMAVQIAVYAGGVMVLFIFGIMLTHQPGVSVPHEALKKRLTALVASLAGIALCGVVIFKNAWRAVEIFTEQELPVQDIGTALMGTDKHQYLLVFELISILLLACIVGAVMIARKRK